ncbi:hypothetical protein LSH36_108g00041 [Paralvinella palmiformis]|uniref:Uncharacterized protein n=1 Tax=Paralvinella palmiformis TaxID=53620 RepID=A0AAD9K0I4_9ANNE|nr:hypothetical protein LSH36_108g00041 [Paralvinella palmiformis]
MPEGSKYLNDHTCVNFNTVQIQLQATFKQLANDLGIKKVSEASVELANRDPQLTQASRYEESDSDFHVEHIESVEEFRVQLFDSPKLEAKIWLIVSRT